MSVPATRIHALLRSPEVRGINFNYRRFQVTGNAFQHLSRRFADRPIPNRIRVTTNPRIVGRRPLARYNQTNDKINVRSETILATGGGRGVFLHECVHALQDWAGGDVMVYIAEGLATVAETWYYLSSGVNIAGLASPPHADIVAVTQELRAAPGAISAMTQPQFQRVRGGLRSMGYRGGRYEFDGLRGSRRTNFEPI